MSKKRANKTIFNSDLEMLKDMSQYLRYDSLTGIFTWIKRTSKFSSIKIGQQAGSINGDGYLIFMFKGVHYRCCRIAWLFYYGVLPSDLIDHRDGIRINDCIANLRECSNMLNQQNRKYAKYGTATGLLGVSFQAKTGKYATKIRVDKKTIFIGLFNTPEQANQAYLDKKRELHQFCTI